MRREPGLDVLRVLAVFFVVSVHFFLNNGFYSQKMEGTGMWAAACFRWLFFCCVPLFLLITGYLKGEKRLTMGYYGSIIRILVSWLLISFLSTGFKSHVMGIQKPISGWIGDILDFKGANYSWYVEMYIGLFLLIPFLNQGFHSIRTQTGHMLFLGILYGLSIYPSFFCISIENEVWKLLPDYWTGLWPFAYYMTGCYIRKYRPAPGRTFCLLLAAFLALGKGSLTFFTARGGTFGDGFGGGYSDPITWGISLLLFLGLYRLELSPGVSKGFLFFSKISFELYLLSWIFDQLIYTGAYGTMDPSFYGVGYILTCIPVFFLAAALAVPVFFLSGFLSRGIRDGMARCCCQIKRDMLR